VASSSWAGAITRVVEDEYQLGMRGVAAHVADLRQAVVVLEQRCALRPGEPAPAERPGSGDRGRRGYRSAGERCAKTQLMAEVTAAAQHRRSAIDAIVAETHAGVAAIAPSTDTPAGRQPTLDRRQLGLPHPGSHTHQPGTRLW
jgi:hypothetical protein